MPEWATKWDRGGTRHVLLRAGLAFVMSWFGIQELRRPAEWAVFVPSFIANNSPVAVNDLILLHGFLLILAAASVLLGVLYLFGCLLAVGLTADIVFGLWVNDGVNDLVIRDAGLLAMAAGLALDPVRVWRLDDVFPRLWAGPASSRATRRRDEREGRGAARQRAPWLAQSAGGAVLLAAVLGLSLVLYATGSGGSGLPDGAVASAAGATASSSATPAPSAPATPAPSTPAPSGAAAAAAATPPPASASSILFDTWQYKSKSFQVYPGDISSATRAALAGFDVSVQDNGGTVTLTLKALSSRYKDSQWTVAKGDTAYFIETSMRDDPSGAENELNDDGVVVVNADGYLVP